jgi:predicted secreted protein
MNAISFLIFITIFTYSCSSSQKPAMKDTFSTEGCPENISIKLGQTCTLKLPAIEGTGYLWIPKSSSLLSWNDEEKYEKVKADSTSDIPKMVGSPTRQILTCKGLKTGNELIIIEYVRPFGNRKPEKLCQFNLNVIN